VNDSRFVQHFAVHEIEAWLLADPSIFTSEVRDALGRWARNPESIDFDRPPSKLLEQIYADNLQRGYQKVTDGTNLFRQFDPEIARGKCPQLASFLDELVGLAKAALKNRTN